MDNEVLVGAPNAAITYDGGSASSIIHDTEGLRSGMSITTVATATGISNAPVYTFCLPILSGIIGANASKLLNVGDLAVPLHIDILLATLDDAIVSQVAESNWQIVNLFYLAII
jgi:hypothetical protein